MPYRLNPQFRRFQPPGRFRRGFGSSPSPTVQQALQGASSAYGVPLPLLTAVARAESGFNPAVTSSAGAQGLMQIMPANDASLGLSDPFDPVQSANAGAKYLSQLHNQYGGDWNTALIAYNEGPGNLAQKGVFPASQSYADSILADAGIADSTSDGGLAPDPGMPADSGGGIIASDGLSSTAWLGLAAAGAALVLWAAG